MLYDAKTGYVWNSVLYSDKDIDGIDYGNGKYHATHIVCYYQKIFSTKGIAFMLTTGILQLKFAKYWKRMSVMLLVLYKNTGKAYQFLQ